MIESMKFTRLLDGAAGVVLALLTAATFLIPAAGRATASEPDNDTLKAAHEMVTAEGRANKGNDTLVLDFAYPTAKKLTRVTYLSKNIKASGAFDLIYKYDYRDSDNDAADFQLRFSFTVKGKLSEVAPVVGKHSSFWPPFSTAEIAFGVMKEAIRNDEKLKKDPVWKQLLDVEKATEALILVLNIKAGK